ADCAGQAAGPGFDGVLRGSQRARDRVERILERALGAGDLRGRAALERLELRPGSTDAAGSLGPKRLELVLQVREPVLELLEAVLRGAPCWTAPRSIGHGSSQVTA